MMLSTNHLARCCLPSVRNVPCCGMALSTAAVSSSKAAVATDPTGSAKAVQRTKPNIVRLPELNLKKPYTDEQFASNIRPYYEQKTPVKFSTQQNSFPFNSNASAKWSSLDYLLETIGDDHPCDVECKTSASVISERMTIDFAEYADYLKTAQLHYDIQNRGQKMPRDELMYMAQNDIPPSLLPDVTIPGFCSDPQYNIGEGKLYNTMIWIGPRDCESRLHYDPLDNIFMQIVGAKRIYLIEPNVDTDLIYVDTSVYQQHNMSNVESMDEELALLSKEPPSKLWKTKQIEEIGESEYTNLIQVPTIYETEVHPGDLLYIPQKWWHTMRSLEFSISVNAWWR